MRDIDNELFSAVAHGHHLKIKRLIKQGADINAIAEHCSAKATRPGFTPLMTAVNSCRFISVKTLIEQGADINYMTSVDVIPKKISFGTDKTTALHIAVQFNHQVNTVKFLVKNGADINTKDVNGDTALMAAMKIARNDDTVIFLIESNPDLSITNNNGLNAFQIAEKLPDGVIKQRFLARDEKNKLGTILIKQALDTNCSLNF